MRRVVVESPFAGDESWNLRYLRACLRDCILRGESPYASHGLLTQEGVLRDDVPEERKKGIEAGYAWWDDADAIVFYTDLGWSNGMKATRDRLPYHDRRGDCEKPAFEERSLGPNWHESSTPFAFMPSHLLHVIREAYGWLAGTHLSIDPHRTPMVSRIAAAERALGQIVLPRGQGPSGPDLASVRLQDILAAVRGVARADTLAEVRDIIRRARTLAALSTGSWAAIDDLRREIKELPGYERPMCTCLARELELGVRTSPDVHHPDCPWRVPPPLGGGE